jgi:hypothetical protein
MLLITPRGKITYEDRRQNSGVRIQEYGVTEDGIPIFTAFARRGVVRVVRRKKQRIPFFSEYSAALRNF